MSQSMNPKKNRLSLMALEHRWVFDGAAPVDALQKLGSDTPLHLFDLAAATGSSPLLAQAQKDAQNTIAQWMSQPDAAQKLAGIYAGGQPSQDWLDKAQGVVDAFRRGELSVRVELRSSQELMGLWAAFAGQNGQGDPVIYINADWLQTTGNDAQAVGRVLAEEWGHYLDVQLNGQMDAEGDEGELFAASVYQLDLSQAQRDRIAFENDHIKLYIDGREVQVEMASLLFNGQSYFAGIAPLAAGASTADGTTGGQTAQLESNVLYIGNKLLGDRTVFVSDPPDAAYYSGNNVRGWLYAIDTNNNIVGKYYGEISRLIKEGSAPVAAQMYVYNDPQQPGITNQLATTIILDFYKDRAPTLATGQIAKTSSDPVASALNSLLPVNQPPTANPDTGFALEAGGLNNATPGSNASGNVISGSDTDPNSTYVVDLASNKLITVQDVLTITKVSNASAGTTTTTVAASGTNINGLYGTLTMAADGTYTYVVNNNLAAVQALRGTSNTLNDVYTYTVSDGKGGFSTTTLTITVRGANDNPQAKDDYNFAKESIESTVANQYSATDAFGQKATGNVLTNDTDIDGYSETKRVAGVTASATVTTVSTSLTLNFTSVPSNVSVGRFVWLDSNNTLDNVTGTLLKDASGNPITVTAVTSTTATLSGVPVNAQGVPIDLTPNMILGFSNNTAGASYSEARIKDAGIAPSNTLRVNALGTGQVTVGMTVSGDGVPANTTITGITYNADGTINRITISNQIAVSSATLNFSAATFPMTLTGQYGTLVLQENGDYVYTPFANNPALNSGDMFVDAFRYNMWDAAGAVSTATLYINVMGSGPSDPDANADTVTAIEAGGTANGTAGNNPTGNLLSNDTLGNVPSGATLSVVAVKTTETAPANASALTGSITFDGVTYAARAITGLAMPQPQPQLMN